jgi:hypothetical protein
MTRGLDRPEVIGRAWYLAGISIIALQILSHPATTYAQVAPCNVMATLLPDFTKADVVEFDATVSTEDCVRNLSDRGLDPLRTWQSPGDQTWSVHGQVRSALLSANGDGKWTLRLRTLALEANDRLAVKLPFAHVDYANIRPAPTNLKALTTGAAVNLDGRVVVPQIVLAGGSPQGGGGVADQEDIEIPFQPVRNTITLTLQPLLGGLLDDQTDAFRVSGNVSFDLACDPAEIVRHCQGGPIGNDNYGTADLLFALDMPPRFNATILPIVYGSEPTYLSVASTLTNCTIDESGRHVGSTFKGRAFHFPADPSRFPESWAVGPHLCKRQLLPTPPPQSASDDRCPPGIRENQAYEIDVGEIVLSPGDKLDVLVPGAALLGIDLDPPPHLGSFVDTNSAPLEYVGPSRFTLRVVYRPAAGMITQQFPAITCTLLSRPLTMALLVLGDPTETS